MHPAQKWGMSPMPLGSAIIIFLLFLIPSAHAQTTIIGNTHMELEFEQNGSEFYLKKITNNDEGYAFILNDHPLWTITGLDPQTLQTIPVDEVGIPTISEAATSNGKKWTLAWNDLGSGSERIDVALIIELEDEDAIADVYFDITNDVTIYTLESVDFHLHIPEAIGEDDFAVTPWRGGHEIRKPADNMIAPNYGTSFRVPFQGSVQLFPYYTQSGKGIYLATADEDGHFKRIEMTGNGSELHYRFHQEVPGTFTSGKEYTSPYPIRLGVFQGKWWEASQIYRDWAEDQEWTEKGKVENRSDIPAWVKGLKLITTSNGDTIKTPQEWLNGFTQLKQYYGLEHLGVWWQSWFADATYLVPTPGMSTTTPLLRSANIYSFPYIHAAARASADGGSTAYQDARVLQLNGQPILLQPPYTNAYILNPSLSYTQQSFRDTATAAAQNGSMGIYWDVPEQFIDYTTTRTHLPGGGNYFTQGNRELLQAMREEMKQTNPTAGVLFPEAAQENYIDVMDFMMTDFMSYPITPPDQAADTFIPLFQAIYHDYILTYLSADRLYSIGVAHPDHYDAIHAIGFTAGNILSSREDCFIEGTPTTNPVCQALGAGMLTTQMPIMQSHTQFMKRMIDARQYAKKFLAFGRMMKPLNFSTNQQTYIFGDSIIPGEIDKHVRVNDVLASVWKSNDKEIGIVLTNHTPSGKTINYTLAFSAYGKSGTLHAYEMDSNGSTYLQAYTGNMTRTETIPPKSVKVIRLTSTAPTPTLPPVIPPTTPNLPPTITIESPVANADYTQGKTIPFRARITNTHEPNELLTLTVYLRRLPTTGNHVIYQTTLAAGTGQQVIDYNYSTPPGSEGTYAYMITLADTNNNLVQSPTQSFQITEDIQPTPIPYCGDGTCNQGETCQACPRDCACPPSPPPIQPPAPDPTTQTMDWSLITLIIGGGVLLGGATILFMQRR